MTGTELRAVPLAPLLGGTALGAVALAVDGWLVRGGPGSALLWFALAGFASAAAFVLDEPAAAVVDAVPRTRRTRTLRRVLAGLVPLALWLGGTAVAVRSEPALSWPALAVTGTGFIAITLGAAATLRRSGHDSPGELVAAGAGSVVVLSLVAGVPKVGPLLEAYDVSSRAAALWIAATVVAVALLVWGGADPLTRWACPGRSARSRGLP